MHNHGRMNSGSWASGNMYSSRHGGMHPAAAVARYVHALAVVASLVCHRNVRSSQDGGLKRREAVV